MKAIKLEETLRSFLTTEAMLANNPDYTYNMVLSAMREACKQTLELAAEKAEVRILYIGKDGLEIRSPTDMVYDKVHLVNKQSILDVINQIK